MQNQTGNLYNALIRTLLFAAGLVILIWFLEKIVGAILILLFAIVLSLIINHPVSALEKKKIPRGWASLIVFGAILTAFGLLIWFVGPRISEQLSTLITGLPEYGSRLTKTISSWFSGYPELQKSIMIDSGDISHWLPSVPKTLMRVGNFSLSLLGGIVIFIIFISIVVYAVSKPHPLVELYLSIFPPSKREKAAAALSKTSVMLNGWIKANLIGGSIEAVLVTAFLTIMQVPGAWVWGALALFAELVPKIGFYIMSIPPVLVALSVDPGTALWVAIFFLALNEIMGDFVMPKLRSSTMNLHPVSTLFILLAMGSAFGLTGALMATPLAAIIKAFYEEFYIKPQKKDETLSEKVDSVIYKNA